MLDPEKVAKKLDVAQENVSRLEGREDPKLSTVAAYVKALGGTLEVQAVFPDGSKVRLRNASAAIKRSGVHRRHKDRAEAVAAEPAPRSRGRAGALAAG